MLLTLAPKQNEVLIKVDVCGLCNWELNHWKGLLDECPMFLGHEIAGTVVEIGDQVKTFEIGDIVTGSIDPGFTDYVVANPKKLFKVNKSVNPLHALSEPLKCVITVVSAVSPKAGDVGVVVGCGPMGLWCIQALSGHLLSKLIAVDVSNDKLEMAKKFGASHVINPKEEDVVERLRSLTNGHMGDFVIEGTGNPSVLNNSITYLKETGRGKLLVMSSYESVTNSIDLRNAIVRGIEIIFPHPRYSLNPMDDWRRAVEFINNGTFKMDGIISHVFSLENIQEAFETLENKPANYIKGIVIP